jgi:hypothetical protein
MNAALTPNDVRPGSEKKVWWRCHKNRSHEWQAQVYSRSSLGTGCPICRGSAATPTTSLRATHPELAREWHRTKNGPRTPDSVKAGSQVSAWWQCRKDTTHEWEMLVSRRAKGGLCPFCRERLPTPKTSLRARFPAVAAQWHGTKNGALRPENVTYKAGRKVWWQCSVHPSHVWAALISNRTRLGSGCPFCHGPRASESESLRVRFPAIARQWHRTRNGDLTPADVRPFSQKVVWWRCRRSPAHEWRAPIVRFTAKGRGCPECRKTHPQGGP